MSIIEEIIIRLETRIEIERGAATRARRHREFMFAAVHDAKADAHLETIALFKELEKNNGQ